MTRIMELPYGQFKTTMTNVLRTPVDKADCMQEQRGKMSKHENSKNQKEMPDIKTS